MSSVFRIEDDSQLPYVEVCAVHNLPCQVEFLIDAREVVRATSGDVGVTRSRSHGCNTENNKNSRYDDVIQRFVYFFEKIEYLLLLFYRLLYCNYNHSHQNRVRHIRNFNIPAISVILTANY